MVQRGHRQPGNGGNGGTGGTSTGTGNAGNGGNGGRVAPAGDRPATGGTAGTGGNNARRLPRGGQCGGNGGNGGAGGSRTGTGNGGNGGAGGDGWGLHDIVNNVTQVDVSWSMPAPVFVSTPVYRDVPVVQVQTVQAPPIVTCALPFGTLYGRPVDPKLQPVLVDGLVVDYLPLCRTYGYEPYLDCATAYY